MNYYLVGIKGTGMSALASILCDLGYHVVGSDTSDYYFTVESLMQKEIEMKIFSKENIKEEYTYIISNAYNYDNNEEVKVIQDNELPYFYYQDFIDYFFKGIKIGISGTHGKTTTTSMISKFLEDEKITYLIGDSTGYGQLDYKYFIFEACEYKNHFLSYQYHYLVINNIDYDHPDYFEDINQVIKSFQDAAYLSDIVIINGDDINAKQINHPYKITFGENEECDVHLTDYQVLETGYNIKINTKCIEYNYYLPFTGKHMIYDFLSSFTLLYALGNIPDDLQNKLLNYKTPKRRMNEKYYFSNVIIDDYAHHPEEIKCLLEGIIQKYPHKEMIVIFQPHTYSRTFALKERFKEALSLADTLYIAPTFTSKRETKDKNKEKEVFRIFPNARYYRKEMVYEFKNYQNKVIIFLGAGTINEDIKLIIKK